MRVRVLIAFNGMRPGDVGVPHDEALAEKYVALGLMEIIEGDDDGERQAGPGGPAEGDPGGVPPRTGEHGAAGPEPGEGFGSGGYGTAEGVGTDGVPAAVDPAPYG